MVGPTLVELRERVEALASAAGQYYVVCCRTGDRPIPAAGKRFPDRTTAREAARVAEQYRATLRRYDPQAPVYDLVVSQDAGRAPTREASPAGAGRERAPDDHSPARRTRAEFCHRVAGAVFEALAEADHDGVERAVLAAYFDLAETVDDPDECCLCLLGSTASELHARLAPGEQVALLVDAAARLDPVECPRRPLDATLATLEARGLLERASRSPWSADLDGGAQSVVVGLDGYALPPHDGRLPVLPLTLELVRRRPPRLPQSVEIAPDGAGWRLRFRLEGTCDRDGLVSAPIEGGD